MTSQELTITKLRNLSDAKLALILEKNDGINIVKETARRIKHGLIPLAKIRFRKLSNRALWWLFSLSDCDWALGEIVKRQKRGEYPSRRVTLEEVRDELREARKRYSRNKKKKIS